MTKTIQKITLCYQQSENSATNKIKPEDFLKWAAQDFHSGEKRGMGNALGNIKKSIHSRVDEIIDSSHILYAKDWSWFCKTDQKIEILKKLGIGMTSIANIITKIRNGYEHEYKLPSKTEIEFLLDTTQLWLKETDNTIKYFRIGLVDLPVQSFKCDHHNIIKEIKLSYFKGCQYFWDKRKHLVNMNNNKEKEILDLTNLSWNSILKLEKGPIKNILKSKKYYYLNQANMTKVYQKYIKMPSKPHGFFPDVSIPMISFD